MASFSHFGFSQLRRGADGGAGSDIIARLYEVPCAAFAHLVLPNGGGANAVVFMDGWRDSSAHQRHYDILSTVIAGELKVADQLATYSLPDLETVHTFLDVEKRIASLLTRQVLEASETVNAAKISDLTGRCS